MAVDVVTALLSSSPSSFVGGNSLPLTVPNDDEQQQQQQESAEGQKARVRGEHMGYKKRVYCYACMLLSFSCLFFALNLVFNLSSKLSENDQWWKYLSELNKLKRKNCTIILEEDDDDDCNVTLS